MATNISKDPIEDFSTLKDFLEDNLQFINTGTACFEHKAIQATDSESLNKLKDLELQTKLLNTQIEEMKLSEVFKWLIP